MLMSPSMAGTAHREPARNIVQVDSSSSAVMDLNRIPLAPGQPHLEPLAQAVLGEEGAAQLVVAGQGSSVLFTYAAEWCAAKGHGLGPEGFPCERNHAWNLPIATGFFPLHPMGQSINASASPSVKYLGPIGVVQYGQGARSRILVVSVGWVSASCIQSRVIALSIEGVFM